MKETVIISSSQLRPSGWIDLLDLGNTCRDYCQAIWRFHYMIQLCLDVLNLVMKELCHMDYDLHKRIP